MSSCGPAEPLFDDKDLVFVVDNKASDANQIVGVGWNLGVNNKLITVQLFSVY